MERGIRNPAGNVFGLIADASPFDAKIALEAANAELMAEQLARARNGIE